MGSNPVYSSRYGGHQAPCRASGAGHWHWRSEHRARLRDGWPGNPRWRTRIVSVAQHRVRFSLHRYNHGSRELRRLRDGLYGELASLLSGEMLGDVHRGNDVHARRRQGLLRDDVHRSEELRLLRQRVSGRSNVLGWQVLGIVGLHGRRNLVPDRRRRNGVRDDEHRPEPLRQLQPRACQPSRRAPRARASPRAARGSRCASLMGVSSMLARRARTCRPTT
jgi:hypothetical protein